MTNTTEKAETFFQQVMPDKITREYLQRVLGYCLLEIWMVEYFLFGMVTDPMGKVLYYEIFKSNFRPIISPMW
jgi:hypothetical protein